VFGGERLLTAYAASEGGIMLLMKSIAQELGPQKIRVNSIGPGAIRTNINRDAWQTPDLIDEEKGTHLFCTESKS
jgi:NAD(P)-dependent dehydrogenase (short-subunit alcohol dehydrogenase family)